MSLHEQIPSYPGQQSHPGTPPPPPRGTSGLAIAGLILAFVIAPIGFLLSLIAIFKTGANKDKGRGLAVTGLIVSTLIIAGSITAVVMVANSTVLDPGCTAGKDAILNSANSVDPAGLDKTVTDLEAAAAKSKKDEVKAALNDLIADYKAMQAGVKTGEIPADIEKRVEAHATTFDNLCTVGG